MTKLKSKDFIEIEFTGKVKDGEVFDSNIKKDLEKIPDSNPANAKPFVFGLGQGMFLKGADDFLIGKEPGKEYEVELEPENAFGHRDSKLTQLMPIKVFIEKQINPVQGAVFDFDGKMGKILSVSGGRVITDFNHPLAGKTVQYKIKINKKITAKKEKAAALVDFLFKQEMKFEIKEKEKKLILHVPKQMKQFTELFKDKFKEILGLDLEVKEIGEDKEHKAPQ